MPEQQPRFFDEAYVKARAPWNIGRPQGAIKCLAEQGSLKGRVLDVGCGEGDIALFAADCGHEVVGVDASPTAIGRARIKAERRGAQVEFVVGDALDLAGLGQRFETIVDSGLFHVFGDEDRARYVRGLRSRLTPGGVLHLLCFSELEPAGYGPRRVTQQEIRDAFGAGWQVRGIHPAVYETTMHDEPAGGARAWLAVIERTADEAAGASA